MGAMVRDMYGYGHSGIMCDIMGFMGMQGILHGYLGR